MPTEHQGMGYGRAVPPALLTDEERARGVRAIHELPAARQQAVKAAMKALPASADFGMAVG
jgi:hypothetical protein